MVKGQLIKTLNIKQIKVYYYKFIILLLIALGILMSSCSPDKKSGTKKRVPMVKSTGNQVLQI